MSYMSQWPRGVKQREHISKLYQGYGSETEVPTSRGRTRWVLDFRTLNSVSASQDTHSEKSSSSPAPRSRNESPVPTSWNEESPPPPASGPGHGQPWSAGSWGWSRADIRGPRPHSALPRRAAPPILRTRVESHPPLCHPPQFPVPLTSFAKNTNRRYRKRKWVFQSHIETNMQT